MKTHVGSLAKATLLLSNSLVHTSSDETQHIYVYVCMCVCVCVRECVRPCVCVCCIRRAILTCSCLTFEKEYIPSFIKC